MLPTLHVIDGAKFELNSIMSRNFQTSHAFSWGSAQNPPTYHFGAAYSAPSVFLQGSVDHDGTLQARSQYNWIPLPEPPAHPTLDPAHVNQPTHADEQGAAAVQMPEMPRVQSASKVQALLSQQKENTMVLFEHDHQDLDWSFNIKAINPNPLESETTGTFTASYLQSVSPSLSVGGEYTFQRTAPETQDSALSFAVKYAPPPKELPAPALLPPGFPSPYMPVNPKDSTEVFCTTWSPATGLLNSSYWRRINQRLEIGSELQMLLTPSTARAPGRREGIAFVGFKLDTVYATIRAMVSSHGQVSAVVEEKIAPGLSLQLCGELDYSRGAGGSGRVGLGFTLEA